MGTSNLKKNERLQIENKNLLCLLMLELNRVEIEKILLHCDILSVGVYGMNSVGRILMQMLEKRGVNCIAIDQRGKSIVEIPQIYTATEKWPDVDIFIVTGEIYWDEIRKNIRRQSDRAVVKASDFLEEILSFVQDYRKNN